MIGEYEERDRVRAGDRDLVLETAHQAWKHAREDGRSVVVMAADRDTVDQLAMRARAARVHAGKVETGGITLGNQTVGVGDEIVTTRNDRRLVTTAGAWVRNGDRWKIEQHDRNGSLRLRSLDSRGTVTIPGDYVQEHVALAYAVTVHRSQGLTVDHAVLVVDRSTSAEHLYVGMTRGRHHNLACVIAEPPGDEHTRGSAPTAEEVLAGVLRQTSGEESSSPTPAALASTAWSIPVTASAMTSASARVRYLTRRDDPGFPCLAR